VNKVMRTTRSILPIALLLLLWVTGTVHAVARGPSGTIRVGIFPLEPFNFIDEQGVAQGLNPDLLREIVRDEDWTITFVPGSWAENLERLHTGEIDLMVSVAYTPERAEIMDFTYEPVAELWGQVFLRPEGSVPDIAGLAGRTVAVMRKDISGSNFIKILSTFNIGCTILEYATHAEVFAAVRKGEADAGVAPQHFGLRHAKEYRLIGSSILFNPFSIYFASKKGKQHELLSHIDAHLSAWKKNEDSFYYQSLNQWMGNRAPQKRLSGRLLYFLLATVGSALLFAALALYMKRAVRLKTEELRESEEKYRVLFNTFPLGITVSDRDGTIVETNASAAAILGISGDEHHARCIDGAEWHIIRPDGTPMPKDEYASVRALQENCLVNNVEMGILRPDGAVTWISASAAPLHLQKFGVVVTYGDITERRKAEEALASQERKYRDLFEAHQDGISLFRINPDRTPAPFLDVNEAAAAMVGYSKLQLAGMTAMDVEIEVPPDILAQRVTSLEQTGQIRFETVLIAKDQRKIPVEVLARAIVYEGGPAVMNIVRDISERKQAETALQASLAEKEVLLREVHHRVKNNLAAIVGLFDLQRQALDDPQALTVLAELNGRIRSMSLVHEKLYRSDSLASIDFQEYLQSLISHLRTSFGTARIRCEIAAQGVPMPLDLAVPCGMIINELVTNALKYAFPENGTHPGDGDCRIHVAVSHDHTTFTLSVADNGIGLPADFDWSTAKTLGLTLVRMLGQHQLGGRYEVDLRQGTRFTLTFTPRTRNHAHA